jgi:hypothetical protein
MEAIAGWLQLGWPALTVIIGAPAAWFVTNFLAGPIRRFFDLRREVKQLTLLLWDTPEYGTISGEEWREQMEPFMAKRDRLTELAAEIFALGQSEMFASFVLSALRFDLKRAGRAVKKVAFELGTNIEDRSRNYRSLDMLLKFPFDEKRPFYDPYRE